LDRIKREIRPPSPRINDESPQKPNRAHFPIIEMGGRGGPNFSFELSKIAILNRIKREIRPPSPRIKDESPQKPKRAHFPIIEKGGRGGPNFSFELSKIVAVIIWVF